MKTYRIPNTDLIVSRIAYGCATLGRWDGAKANAEDRARAETAVHTAYENGITLFDHADIYGFGTSESTFGEVLKQSQGLRNRIVIQSKCGQVLSEGWRMNSGKPIRVDLSRAHIVSSVEGSLRRLQTDYLDILLLHAPSMLVNPQEVDEAFEKLHRGGKVRYFGVSNHNGSQIELLRKFLHRQLVVNQIHLGLGSTDAFANGAEFTLELVKGVSPGERYVSVSGGGAIDYCRVQDIQIQAWSPLPREMMSPGRGATPQVRAAVRKLGDLALAKGSSPTAVALAWLLHHPVGVVPIIGAGNPAHIVDNCAADSVNLTDQEWYDLLAAWMDLKFRSISANVGCVE